MNRNSIKRLIKYAMVYFCIMVIFRYAAGSQIDYKYEIKNISLDDTFLQNLYSDGTNYVDFTPQTGCLNRLDFTTNLSSSDVQGKIKIEIIDIFTGKVLEGVNIELSSMCDGKAYEWNLQQEIIINETNNLKIVLYDESISFNSQSGIDLSLGNLQINYVGKTFFLFGQYYWQIVLVFSVSLILCYLGCLTLERHGKRNLITTIMNVWIRYKFLIKQLVSRDFKTKYKRSVLGYLWSFLNPLLTMSVQYIVFSTIFRAGIDNFPVYLLSGIILFNFFTEAVSQGLNSILANASLITKVYVPKYIYPVTKVVSCAINLVISVIPLLLVTVFTGESITKAFLLLPFALICLLMFSIGMAMLLATSMVFFRDTQYLWGIFSLAWMYATPLFYPENIIPEKFKFIQTLNPIYHFVRFVRVILINGVSPEPKAYLYCAISAIAMCLVGAFVFKKFQDKFILYI